jgi:hypothetical protein
MKTLNDWKFVCANIEKYLSDNSVSVLDFYLVGSKVENENSNSDFDSLIIVDGSADIISLRRLRQNIDTFIQSENISDLFHYKLFNADELKLIASYDAFRLADFQRRNISIKNSQIINSGNIILDEKSFVNSFLIQLVHKFMHNFDSPNTEDIYSKLLFWVYFNLDIKEIIPKSSVNFQYFIDNDSLTSNLWNFFHSDRKDQSEITALLDEYSLRLRHESINKHDTYFKMIASNEKPMHKKIHS